MNDPAAPTEQKEKDLTRDESFALVVATATKAHELITEAMNRVPKMQRWLVHGRIVSALFQRHFRLSYETAEDALRKKEE